MIRVGFEPLIKFAHCCVPPGSVNVRYGDTSAVDKEVVVLYLWTRDSKREGGTITTKSEMYEPKSTDKNIIVIFMDKDVAIIGYASPIFFFNPTFRGWF